MTDRKSNYYWTFEKCREEALKYTTKKEFAEKSLSCYVKSNRSELPTHSKADGMGFGGHRLT